MNRLLKLSTARDRALKQLRPLGHAMRWGESTGTCRHCGLECRLTPSQYANGGALYFGSAVGVVCVPKPRPSRLKMALPSTKDDAPLSEADELRLTIRRLMAFWLYSTDDDMPADLYDAAIRQCGDAPLASYTPQYRKFTRPLTRGACTR